MQSTHGPALLAARVLMAAIFIITGYNKIGGYAGTQKYMAANGVPDMLLPLVILVEIGGGLLILLGFQTRLVAILLAGFTLIAALLFHAKLGDTNQMIQFLKNLAIAGGFLTLFVAGPGPFSIDARQK